MRPRFRAALAPLTPWLGLALLCVLFELPSAVKPGDLNPGAMRPTLDVLALLTLWGVSHVLPRGGRWLRRAVTVAAIVLCVFELDVMIFTQLMREDPLLYDQWFMIRHLFVLIGDLMSPTTGLAVLGFVAAVALLSVLARRLLRHALRLLEPAERARTLRVTCAIWLVALGAFAASHESPRPWVRALTPRIVENLATSYATYASIQRGIERSPYAAFSRVTLTKKPDVLLFIVESYGRLLATHEDSRDRHALLLDRLEGKLTQAGWHAVTAYGTSAVSGGRSWLAEGTMLMGTPIRYEAVFQHLVAKPGRVPSLVGFLAQQGYETVLLAPSDRERPGIHAVQRYPFSRVLDYDDMGYRGPAMGWGIVPDQYSLAVAREKVIDGPRKQPLFLDYHMVSSHAPWAVIPPLVSDPRSLDDLRGNFARGAHDRDDLDAVLTPIRWYERDRDAVHPYMNHLTEPMRRGYQATVSYDLNVITRYLGERTEDALVIIIGDHQPPVITQANASFDTPVHVLARDPKLLAEFAKQGFVTGLSVPDDAKPALSHAGLFSLLVRALASYSEKEAPTFLRSGFALLDAR